MMKMIKVTLTICFLTMITFAVDVKYNIPDVVTCQFKVQAVLDYSVGDKRFDAVCGKDSTFSFKIAGISKGKPVIVGEIASNELVFIKNIGNVIYLVENIGNGYNVIALFLKTKKVTLTKQYDIGNGSPFVYSWVGEAIY